MVLVATSRVGSPGFAGLAIGLALAVVHLIGGAVAALLYRYLIPSDRATTTAVPPTAIADGDVERTTATP